MRGRAAEPEQCGCLQAAMPHSPLQRGTPGLHSQKLNSGRNMFDGLKY